MYANFAYWEPYQHDRAPWHTSNVVEQKSCDLKLNLFDWAPKSPDLNPIEMLWSIINFKKLAAIPIYCKVTLEQRLNEEWKNVDRDVCARLIHSMPERIRKCLKAKIHYLNKCLKLLIT